MAVDIFIIMTILSLLEIMADHLTSGSVRKRVAAGLAAFGFCGILLAGAMSDDSATKRSTPTKQGASALKRRNEELKKAAEKRLDDEAKR